MYAEAFDRAAADVAALVDILNGAKERLGRSPMERRIAIAVTHLEIAVLWLRSAADEEE
ncbi:MAG: hypothetical protein M3Q74_09740 [Pseudomonadota bacterium]|nr:hypothetical protein [Pseudomonadota bacterium]